MAPSSLVLADLSPAIGPLYVAATLLVVAGVAKLGRPAPTGLALARAGLPGSDPLVRALGAVEVVAGAAAVALGGPLAAPVAVAYLAFAAFTVRQARSGADGRAADCGCFGDASSPVGWTHVVLNLALAGGVTWALVDGVASLPAVASDSPPALLGVVALAAVAVASVRAAMTDLPAVVALTRPSEAEA